ncbi:MAG: 1-acyl-sn-glycerol-3-phosphate acyltransferase [Deltaproteobacteria bacterium]|nr:1-acyl-sn-glycerol-3-phosphate acyltransferase [Deltaproteobacteria bacterium]
MTTVRPFFNALAVGGLTTAWSSLALGVLPLRNPRATGWVAKRWAQSVLSTCGVEVLATGLDQPFDAPSYLVMANHVSLFDVPALYAVMPFEMKAIAKKELTYIPVFGWALALGGAVVVDRKSRARAIASIDRAAETIRAGQSVLMFPEGTRSTTGTLGSLKKGPFHLALAARVPILPVGLRGTAAVLAKGDWRVHPGTIQLAVGNPIFTEDREDSEAGRAALSAEVAETLGQLASMRNRS